MGGIVVLYWMVIFTLVIVVTHSYLAAGLAASALTLVSYIVVHFVLLATSIGRTDVKKLHGTDPEPYDSKRS